MDALRLARVYGDSTIHMDPQDICRMIGYFIEYVYTFGPIWISGVVMLLIIEQ